MLTKELAASGHFQRSHPELVSSHLEIFTYPFTRPEGHPLPIRWGEGRDEGAVELGEVHYKRLIVDTTPVGIRWKEDTSVLIPVCHETMPVHKLDWQLYGDRGANQPADIQANKPIRKR